MIDEEIADFAVPATILNEPEPAQTNVIEALRRCLGLELADARVHSLAAFIDHPHDIVGRDQTVGWIIWFAADPFEKRRPLWITPSFRRNNMLLGSGRSRCPKPRMVMRALLQNVVP
jgi:hypothetical protein